MKPSAIGRTVTVTVDRPLGSRHPRYADMLYPLNYGYIDGVIAGDGEPQDAYILGVSEPAESFTGTVIAVYHRTNDVEDKWIVAPEGMSFSDEEILDAIHFQEQFFKGQLIADY